MPAPKRPKDGYPEPTTPTPVPPKGGSGQSPRAKREVRIRVENAGGAEWRQKIGQALGVPLGTVLPTLEEACEMIRSRGLSRAPQLCDEDDCLNLAYRNFAFCHDHIFRSNS